MNKLYEEDYYGWANEQAALLRAGKLGAADIENIAEEIESMGKGEKRELVNRLIVLVQHLLKWEFQPEKRSSSWRATIRVQRNRIASHLADNPSLKPVLGKAVEEAYRDARIESSEETRLPESRFAEECPYSSQAILDGHFWPGVPQEFDA